MSGCSSYQRANDATNAKSDMLGLSKAQVLACMGVPKHKAHVDNTEVWEYASTDGSGNSTGTSASSGSFFFSNSFHQKSFCTVNVVMTDERVTAIHYIGPTGGLLAPDEQCGYAVANCVAPD